MDDRALWLAYETADTAAERLHLAGRIVETHIGFLHSYARKTRFPYWSDALLEEYLHELVLEALKRVETYNRRHRGYEQKLSAFPTYLKPYLQPVRWAIAGREAPLPVGRENRRMRADAQRFIREFQQQSGGADPTWHDVAAAVSRAHGKKVSPQRVERLTNPPSVLSGDIPDDSGSAMWDRQALAAPSVEDQVVAEVDRDDVISSVHAAVLTEVSTPLERAIVHMRLMAPKREVVAGEVVNPGPMSHRDLADRHGVPISQVAKVEEALVERLRTRLCDPRLTRE